MPRRRAYIRQAGVVCSLGRGVEALRTGLGRAPPEPTQLAIDELARPLRLPYLRADFPETDESRNTSLLRAAVEDALSGMERSERAQTAVFVASSSVDLFGEEPSYAAAVARGEAALAFGEPRIGRLAGWLCEGYGLGGADYSINTACSSGANALLYAAAAIARGDCRHALVVGLEVPTRVTLSGFQALMLLATNGCRPFDANRDGILLGETACALLLSADAGKDFGELVLHGGASACDTGSPTHTSAEAVTSVVEAALAQAAASPVAIKAHGTGTPSNDAAEAHGVQAVPSLRDCPMTALKPVLGHTLGACGVLETIAMATCAADGMLPACQGLREPDPDLPRAPQTKATVLPRGDILLTYFGFGGNNCALVLGPAR